MAVFQSLKKDQLLHTAQVRLTELSLFYQFDPVLSSTYRAFCSIFRGFYFFGIDISVLNKQQASFVAVEYWNYL